MVWPCKTDAEKPEAQELPDDLIAQIDRLLTHYPNKHAALIPSLRKCQEHFGCVSFGIVAALAERLDMAPSHVADTLSFYSMLRTTPVGKYHIELCRTISCALRGADSLADYLVEKLGIGFGEVTPDKKFSLGKVECIGACEQAPAMLVNNELYGNLSRERIDEILRTLESGAI
ncbi:MAG: NAD(P)H-dependent oxidoreductase subunit E [Candidatus Hydrogenedentota bacterium]|nr:MAG: NAD(P)H-dependent oxidoreductase subunit E [Candidatus Hydrogenedentota bacterium]